jgi:NADH:ubiquinone oxidoreductase subunit D
MQDLPCPTTRCSSPGQEAHPRGSAQGRRRPREGLLNRNRIFMDRTQGIGAITKQDAIDWSWTGPCARASGVVRDVRKDEPYLCYADNWDGQGAEAVKFKVPVTDEGDCYARYLVRVEEIKQSICKIIEQLIDNIPGGPCRRLRRLQGRQAPQEGRLRLHRRPHPALRAHHDQPRLQAAGRRVPTAPSNPPTANSGTSS